MSACRIYGKVFTGSLDLPEKALDTFRCERSLDVQKESCRM